MMRYLLTLSGVLGFGLLISGCGVAPPATPSPVPEPTPIPTPSPTSTAIPLSPISVSLELVAEGLTAPVLLVAPPDDGGRLFIVDQIGVIRILTPDGQLLAEPFLDIRHLMVSLKPEHDERGLLGLAFHPQFTENGRFFVYYAAPLRPGAPERWNHTNHLSEFRVLPDNPNHADHSSERVLLQIDNYWPTHMGGHLAFGRDGYLYVAVGDGGGVGDPLDNAQNLEVLLGKILRLDVDGGDPYGIPPDNPFVGVEGRDEIFAYGFREPYRYSFHPSFPDQLIVADVGQALWEEVSIVVRGGNYGWDIKEGSSCYNPTERRRPLPTCPDTGARGEPFIDPIIEYDHTQGLAVIGGFIYRGSVIPELFGHYIFGDWGIEHGRLFIATPSSGGVGGWTMAELLISENSLWNLGGRFILGFGEDENGEIYILTEKLLGPTGNTGKVFRIIPPP